MESVDTLSPDAVASGGSHAARETLTAASESVAGMLQCAPSTCDPGPRACVSTSRTCVESPTFVFVLSLSTVAMCDRATQRGTVASTSGTTSASLPQNQEKEADPQTTRHISSMQVNTIVSNICICTAACARNNAPGHYVGYAPEESDSCLHPRNEIYPKSLNTIRAYDRLEMMCTAHSRQA